MKFSTHLLLRGLIISMIASGPLLIAHANKVPFHRAIDMDDHAEQLFETAQLYGAQKAEAKLIQQTKQLHDQYTAMLAIIIKAAELAHNNGDIITRDQLHELYTAVKDHKAWYVRYPGRVGGFVAQTTGQGLYYAAQPAKWFIQGFSYTAGGIACVATLSAATAAIMIMTGVRLGQSAFGS